MENIPGTTINDSREVLKNLSDTLINYVIFCFNEASQINQKSYENSLTGPYVPADNITLIILFRDSLKNNIGNFELSEQDIKILELYISSLDDLLLQRLIMNIFKSFLTRFTDYIRWGNIYFTQECTHFSVMTIADIKSMVAAFTKLLLKSAAPFINNCVIKSPPHLRDFFRCTCIACNSNDELLRFTEFIMQILTNPNSKEYINFQNWIVENTNSYGGQTIPKDQLLLFKNFKFDVNHIKDFITNPKGDYQALQMTITIKEAPDHLLIGKNFEFKFMTWEMYQDSKFGKSSHSAYKKEIYDFTKKVFCLDHYKHEFFVQDIDHDILLDDDGTVTHNQFYVRRSSGNTIQEY